MTFRRDETILNIEYEGNQAGPAFDADVIFTAAFIGIAAEKSRDGQPWRIDLEPNTDEFQRDGTKMTRAKRTEEDRTSMKAHNDMCGKVNNVLQSYTGKGPTLHWGLTPLFDRGGMICAGADAKAAYAKVDDARVKTAFRYLSTSKLEGGAQDVYIGKGAYCGLVQDNTGSAIAAMSTIRTTLTEDTVGVGERWVPPVDAPARKNQYKENPVDLSAWGVLDVKGGQEELRKQGMRFVPQDGTPDVVKDTVAYTHGMVRAIYEVERIKGIKNDGVYHGPFTAFEMSIGTDTFKLASCLSCSGFMIANGVEASSSHLGKGESWGPYYGHSADSHVWSYVASEEDAPLGNAIRTCNDRYAQKMHQWMMDGVAAMKKDGAKWIEDNHKPVLDALDKFLEAKALSTNTVARDLYLDAMTYHGRDVDRINRTLKFPESDKDWSVDVRPKSDSPRPTDFMHKVWESYFDDAYIQQLHEKIQPLPKP